MNQTYRRHLERLQQLRFNHKRWNPDDKELIRGLLASSTGEAVDYEALFSYLITGFLHYRSSDRAHVYYPGAPSAHGARIDSMEGFCRVLPLICAWLNSGRDAQIEDLYGESVDLLEVCIEGLLAGTDPSSRGYWGDLGDFDQKNAEAADVALSIWLLRDHIWDDLAPRQKDHIIAWLNQVNGKEIVDNNWHFFPLLVNEVLRSLDCPNDQKASILHYERLKSFYRGDGWFSDGPGRRFDFYNAWSIHYSLFWLRLISPDIDPDFIDDVLDKFVRSYQYIIAVNGLPISGRSICYRVAAPSPLIAAAYRQLEGVSAGTARRSLDCVWSYFISRGAVREGKITQGYWHEDLGLIDNYSGPGSCMWSLRSLVLAFFCPADSPFWVAPLEPLPIECGDYSVFIPAIDWEIKGFQKTGEVKVIKARNAGNPGTVLETRSLRRRLAEIFLAKPMRPDNAYLKYYLEEYSSIVPFWEQRRSSS
jgi:hypothetical protein